MSDGVPKFSAARNRFFGKIAKALYLRNSLASKNASWKRKMSKICHTIAYKRFLFFYFSFDHKLFSYIHVWLRVLCKRREKNAKTTEKQSVWNLQTFHHGDNAHCCLQERRAVCARESVRVESDDHWPSNCKNNPQPCLQITSLICVFDCEEEQEAAFACCQVMVLFDQASKTLRLDYVVYELGVCDTNVLKYTISS